MVLFLIWRPSTTYWCIYQTKSNTNQTQFRAETTMEKVTPSSKFVGHSTEIIRLSKIKGPLTVQEQYPKEFFYVITTLKKES